MSYFLLLEDGDFLLLEDGSRIITVFTIPPLYQIKFASANPTLQFGDNDFILKNRNPSKINIKEAQ